MVSIPRSPAEGDGALKTSDHAEGLGVEDDGVLFLRTEFDRDALQDRDVTLWPEAEEGVTDEGTGVHGRCPAELGIVGEAFLREVRTGLGKEVTGEEGAESKQGERAQKCHEKVWLKAMLRILRFK